MVSGPCYQDIDANMLFNREESRATVNRWDPNVIVRDQYRSYPDYRQIGAYDCYVNPSYDEDDFPVDVGAEGFPHIPDYKIANWSIVYDSHLVQNSTIKGSDFDGHRLTVVKKWVEQLRENLEVEQKNAARVLIIPYTSGVAKQRLIDRINFDFTSNLTFLNLEDPKIDQLLEDLGQVHEDTKTEATDASNFHRWENRLMGSSSPSEILDPLFEVLYQDMTLLSIAGGLEQARYDMIFLSDGKLTPIKEYIDFAVKIHGDCNTCMDPNNEDNYQNCPGICGQLRDNIEATIGRSDLNNEETLKMKMNKIQNLRDWFGSGRILNHFVQINEPYYEKVYRKEGNKSLFEIYYEMHKEKRYNYKYWALNEDELPFDLVSGQNESRNYSLSGLIILNPNVRVNDQGEIDVDSDGDGLFDSDEISENTDPLNPRSNGACLDSMSTHEAYRNSCAKISDISLDCDPYLDSDMDSLNECEEFLLGTSPFDFDTDGDLIPDYFEWIYNFNPLLNDKILDTNSDGVTNYQAFQAGLGPNHNFDEINESYITRFEVDEGFSNSQEDNWVNTLLIKLESFPFLDETLHGSMNGFLQGYNECVLYRALIPGSLTSPCSFYSIDLNNLFFGTNLYSKTNTIIALAKLRDKSNDQNIRWKILKVQFSRQDTKSLNFRNFIEFKVIDEASD